MKMIKWTIMAALCLMLFVSQQAFAKGGVAQDSKNFSRSVSLGFTLYYTWWTPMFKFKDKFGQNHIAKITSAAPVFGPSLIVTLSPRWSLSANIFYGKFNFARLGVHKLEFDTIASYRIRTWLRFYIGLKYFGIKAMGNNDNRGGLGTGFSFTIALYKGLYLLPNISVLTLANFNFLTLGANSSVSLAYIIEKINLTLALGFRGQYMHDVFSLSGIGLKDDVFFGPNFSVIYTF